MRSSRTCPAPVQASLECSLDFDANRKICQTNPNASGVLIIEDARLADEADQWRAWLARHGPALLLFARQWSATSADAEDALQNGFVRFWKTRRKNLHEGRDELAYLYACVRSAAMDLGRSQRR